MVEKEIVSDGMRGRCSALREREREREILNEKICGFVDFQRENELVNRCSSQRMSLF